MEGTQEEEKKHRQEEEGTAQSTSPSQHKTLQRKALQHEAMQHRCTSFGKMAIRSHASQALLQAALVVLRHWQESADLQSLLGVGSNQLCGLLKVTFQD